MDFFKRIGTDRHKFKVQFFIGKLQSNVKLKGDVCLTIKRGISMNKQGDHKVTTLEKREFGSNHICDFKNQILTFDALTLFFDQDEKKYQEKLGEIRVIFVTQKGQKKLLGIVEFDVGQFANKRTEKILEKKKLQETAKKISMTLEYEVFIKFLGEASEYSKSEAKVERKREGSLWDKIGNFFSSDDPSKQQESEQQYQQKQVKETERKPSKQKTKEEVKNEKRKPVREENDRTRNRNPYAVEGKRQTNQKDEESDNFQENPKNKKMKNYPKQKLIFTEHEGSERETGKRRNREDPTNKDTIRDEVYINLDLHEKCQKQINTLKREKDQYSVELKEILNKLQKSEEEKQSYKMQAKKLLNENWKLSEELERMKKKEEEKSSSRIMFQTERQNQMQILPERQNQLMQKISKLEREKAQCLLKLQEQEFKARKDHKKYEELLEKYEQEKNSANQQMKAEVRRSKEENSQGREKLDKMMEHMEKKSKEARQLRRQNEKLEEELAQTKNILSNLKIKIGAMMNEATNENVIEALQQLNSA